MKFDFVILENFRSFFGKHEIIFSTSDEKPLTIFIGENGSGKTTILNAIYWTFTGKFTEKFRNPHSLINHDAFEAGEKKCSVELQFRDGKDKYRLYRVAHKGELNSILSVHKINNEGITTPIKSEFAESYVRKFMPEKLANWFIFDGEAIDQINLDGDSKFAEDLRRTFGFMEIMSLKERLIELINENFKQEAKIEKNNELEVINTEIEEVEKGIIDYKKRIAELENEIKIEENIYNKKSEELQGQVLAGPVENAIKRAEEHIKQADKDKDDKESRRNQYLVDNSPSKLLHTKIIELEKVLTIKEEEQSLPHPFGDRLIADIKHLKKCICDNPVLPNSKEWFALDLLLDKASTTLQNQRISLIRQSLSSGNISAEKFQINLDTYTTDIYHLESQITDYEEIIRENNEKLKGIDDSKVQEIQKEKNRAKKIIDESNIEKGMKLSRLNDEVKKLTHLEIKRTKLSNEKSRNSTLKKEREKYEKLKNYVEIQFNRQEKEVTETLSSEVSSALNKYLTKHFKAEIDPEKHYKVKTFNSNGTPIDLSQGETKVLKLAVIAAIVGMAGGKTKSSKVDWITDPIIAPLIFDAPFSDMDPVYSTNVAINLSELSGQLILLFDSSKWSTTISDAIKAKVGKFYLINSKAKGNFKLNQKSISINNIKYNLNEYESPRDESICIEVNI